MITVSEGWKAAQAQRLVPMSDISIAYEITQPGLQESATAASNHEDNISQVHLVTELEKPDNLKYMSCEWNRVRLDGSFLVKPDAYLEQGFLSRNVCGSSCRFDLYPVIELAFHQVVDDVIPGMTIVWSDDPDEYATGFAITVLYLGEVVDSWVVHDNHSATYVWNKDLSRYTHIEIDIFSWSKPYRRARLKEVFMGTYRIFGKNDLLGYVHEQSVDLLSAELPKNYIEFRLDNSDQRWNPDNLLGSEKHVTKQQRLVVRYGLEVNGRTEWIKAGVFYMSEWDTPANGLEATFTARDLLEFCTETYTGTTAGTLMEVVTAAVEQADIKDSQCYFDTVLATILTDFTEEHSQSPLRICDVLQMAANAAQCCLWQDRFGVLRIEPLNETLTDYVIGNLNAGSIGATAVSVGDDILDDTAGVVGYTSVNTSYTHPEYSIAKVVKGVIVNDGFFGHIRQNEGVIENLSNPLIVDIGVASQVIAWCMDVLDNRKTVSGEYRADPRLDALDRVTVVDRYGAHEVCITNIRYEYAGAFRGSYTGRVMDGGTSS